jgi:hypothetical protein
MLSGYFDLIPILGQYHGTKTKCRSLMKRLNSSLRQPVANGKVSDESEG